MVFGGCLWLLERLGLQLVKNAPRRDGRKKKGARVALSCIIVK